MFPTDIKYQTGHGLPYNFQVECFILDHYDKEVAFLADTNQLLNFLIRMNQVEPKSNATSRCYMDRFQV